VPPLTADAFGRPSPAPASEQVSATPHALSEAAVVFAKALGWPPEAASAAWRACLVADAAWTAPGEKPAPWISQRITEPVTPRRGDGDAPAAESPRAAAPSEEEATAGDTSPATSYRPPYTRDALALHTAIRR
jgi:hypothetical protein